MSKSCLTYQCLSHASKYSTSAQSICNIFISTNANKYNNYNNWMPRSVPRNRIQIKERRENVLVLLTKGMKGYEIAKELGVDASTVSRDIHYLTGESQNYLSSLAKGTLPFMYQTSTEGIKNGGHIHRR
jgi:DNA-directed RNA polymerase specialized sigma subunit